MYNILGGEVRLDVFGRYYWLTTDHENEDYKAMKSFKKESHIIPQLIVVTHHSELEDIADTLFEVELVNGISEVQERS